MNRRPLVSIGAVAASVALLAGCGGGSDTFSDSDSGDSSSGGGGDTITIGSANFPENELLMNMYALALEDGSIDLLPEYNGALLAFLVAGNGDEVPRDVTAPDQVYDALQDVLPEGTETLPQSEAEDKDTLSVTQETAEEYDLASITDLAPVSDQLAVGAGPEFEERFQGLVGLEDVYGVTFESFRPLDAGGPQTITALKDGDVDVANIFSTDPNIEANDFVVLDDPENLYTSQNILPFIKSDKVTPEVEEALNAVSEALTTDNLTEALAAVVTDKQDSKTVAQQFLEDNGVLD